MTKPATTLQFDAIWTPAHGWIEQGWLAVGNDGLIQAIGQAADAPAGAAQQSGWLLPGFPNSHSHGFQYLMAGLTEHVPEAAADDDFWSWRQAMYEFAQNLSAEHVLATHKMLYLEMLRRGTTHVAEFHYFHRSPDGKRDQANAQAIMQAANEVGIGLTLVPVYYRQGGFDRPSEPHQARFVFGSPTEYLDEIAKLEQLAATYSNVSVGSGFHSLRAASADDMTALAGQIPAPIHIHIAEQMAEVRDCQTHYGFRPVAWLLANHQLDERWNLVHATHMTHDEVAALARSGATAVICPSTEGNLGDGFFDLKPYLAAGGRIAIGSDSHIGLSPCEDLRWLDYGLRLQTQSRNPICGPGDDSADILWRKSLAGGASACGIPTELLGIGSPFTGMTLNPDHPNLVGLPAARRLAGLVFGHGETAVQDVYVCGQKMLDQGQHKAGSEIQSDFGRTAKLWRGRLK